MRILFITTRELAYPRNDVILRALKRTNDVRVFAPVQKGSIFLRSVQLTLSSLPILARGGFDVVFVGFYGHLIMLPFGKLVKTPILFDAFISTFDTLCSDRAIFAPNSMGGRIAYWLDQTSCQMANTVLLDTQAQINYFRDTFSLESKPIAALPVGCNEDLFTPRSSFAHSGFTVLYYCTYLPLHGVDTVVRAAHLINDLPIQFRLIGSGQQFRSVTSLAREMNVRNIQWIEPVPINKIPNEISSADICLGGHFGTSGKASRVIPGKIYQMLAVGRPVIAGDSYANQELLEDGKTARLCAPGNPEILASTIRELYHAPNTREALAIAGRRLYEERCSEVVITRMLNQILNQCYSVKTKLDNQIRNHADFIHPFFIKIIRRRESYR